MLRSDLHRMQANQLLDPSLLRMDGGCHQQQCTHNGSSPSEKSIGQCVIIEMLERLRLHPEIGVRLLIAPSVALGGKIKLELYRLCFCCSSHHTVRELK